jgi:YfiH family protein
MIIPDDWLVPDWPAPAHVHAVCTTRVGGVSLPPYASMNLGDHVGDGAQAVDENRRRLVQALDADVMFLQQVHGTDVLSLPVTGRSDATPVADACLTLAPATVCAIMVADCLPVLFADKAGRCVASAHAGWRGLLGHAGVGVLETTVAAMRHSLAHQDANPALLAWLGPCIGPAAFEVGPDVKSAFEAASPEAARFFAPHAPGKWLADLPGLARQRLQALGLASIHGNNGSAAWCTVTNASRFFSHRRDRVSGRMAACIWRSV